MVCRTSLDDVGKLARVSEILPLIKICVRNDIKMFSKSYLAISSIWLFNRRIERRDDISDVLRCRNEQGLPHTRDPVSAVSGNGTISL